MVSKAWGNESDRSGHGDSHVAESDRPKKVVMSGGILGLAGANQSSPEVER